MSEILQQQLAEIKKTFAGLDATIKVKTQQVGTGIGNHGTRSILRGLGEELGGYFVRFSAFTLAAGTVFKGLNILKEIHC